MRPSLKGSSPTATAWFGGLFLCLLTFSAYIPAIRGAFVWDDDRYAANPILLQPDALRQIWTPGTTREQYYREFPMVYTSFWLERRLWGLRPDGFHIVNIALHVFNAILAWLLLKRLGLREAWLAAAIFALHPVHVESVAWITERKNLLSAFFYLLALNGYLKFEDESDLRWYLGSLVLFVAALLSKPVTCTLPVILLLLRWQRGRGIGRLDMMHLLPFFLLSAGAGAFTIVVERKVIGRPDFDISWAQHILLAGRAFWFYPMKLVWPANLAFSYERWALNAHDVFQWLWVLAALVAGACVWRERNRLGRGILAGLGFYAVTIAPMLGFSTIYTFHFSFVADHYQYLSSLGLIAVGVGSVGGLFHEDRTKPETSRWRHWTGVLLGALALALLGALTWQQTQVYRDSSTLWQDVLSKNPGSFLAHNNLGVVLAEQGNMDEAIRHYSRALQEKPDYAAAHNSLGVALAGQGKTDEAIRQFNLALQTRPDYAEAQNNLGAALAVQGTADEAIRHHHSALAVFWYRKAAEQGFSTAQYNLGSMYARGQGCIQSGGVGPVLCL